MAYINPVIVRKIDIPLLDEFVALSSKAEEARAQALGLVAKAQSTANAALSSATGLVAKAQAELTAAIASGNAVAQAAARAALSSANSLVSKAQSELTSALAGANALVTKALSLTPPLSVPGINSSLSLSKLGINASSPFGNMNIQIPGIPKSFNGLTNIVKMPVTGGLASLSTALKTKG